MSDAPTREDVAKLLQKCGGGHAPWAVYGNSIINPAGDAELGNWTICEAFWPEVREFITMLPFLARAYIAAPSPNALAVEAMKQAACDTIDAYAEYDRQLCCDGHECGCQGATVHQAMKHYILALPSPSPADRLAAAMARPEVKALVAAAERLNAACDAMWNDHKRLETNPTPRFGQMMQIKEVHMKAISEAQQTLPDILAALEGGAA